MSGQGKQEFRVVVKHRTLDKDLQAFGGTIEFIDSWLKANESRIPDGAVVQVFEVKEVLVKKGVIGTVDSEEESRLVKAGLLKDNTELDTDKKEIKKK